MLRSTYLFLKPFSHVLDFFQNIIEAFYKVRFTHRYEEGGTLGGAKICPEWV